MKNILHKLYKKPELFEQTNWSMWEDDYISKGMLKAHLDDTQDSATRKLAFVEKSIDWIADTFPCNQYPKVLDLGCGPGIYTQRFQKKGYHVTGIDISSRSIAYAKKSAQEKGLDITYLRADYTNMQLQDTFHLITMIYCDFGVLSFETRKSLLKDIYQLLRPDGMFLFDVFRSTKYEGMQEAKTWEVCEHGFWHEKLCLILHSFYRYDEDNSFLQQYTIMTKEDEVYRYHIWEHTFTYEELILELTSAGFNNIRFYATVTGDTCTETDDTICIIAQKG